jgi:NADH pyrophosphatase NudC (nudix superfamily)
LIIEEKHYLDIGFLADIDNGEPVIQRGETENIEEVKWFKLDELPAQIFPPLLKYIQAWKTGQVYFE